MKFGRAQPGKETAPSLRPVPSIGIPCPHRWGAPDPSEAVGAPASVPAGNEVFRKELCSEISKLELRGSACFATTLGGTTTTYCGENPY